MLGWRSASGLALTAGGFVFFPARSIWFCLGTPLATLKCRDLVRLNDEKVAVRLVHQECVAGWTDRHKLRMFDGKPSPIGETNGEWIKRFRMGKDLNLIDVHERSITQHRLFSIAKQDVSAKDGRINHDPPMPYGQV